MWDKLRPAWVIIEIAAKVLLALIVCFFGIIAAIAAAVAAVPALLAAGAISLIAGIAFVDALAWTWSILTIIIALAIGYRLTGSD